MPTGSALHPEQEEALLDVLSSIMARSTLPELFQDLVEKLTRFVHFDRLALLLNDEERNMIVLQELFSTLPHQSRLGVEWTPDQTPAGEVIRTQQRLYIRDVETETRYPAVLDLLRSERLKTLCYLPLTSPSHRVGALAFGTRREMEYSEEELAFVERALKPVAIAVENIVNHARVERERDRLKLQLDVNNALVTKLETQELFDEVSNVLQRYVAHEFVALAVWNAEESVLRLRFTASREGTPLRHPDYPLPLDSTPSGLAFCSGKPQVFNFEQLNAMAAVIVEMVAAMGIRSMCSLPLTTARGELGAISLGAQADGAFPPEKIQVLRPLAEQLAIAVENMLAFERVEELNRRLREAKLYLEEELETTRVSDEILGASPQIRKVLQQIETVAPTDATVLICGETGSGKELVARALHQNSPRNRGTFVKLNCAAIPAGLLESELFGHERGAFTGAIAQKIGRFEIAHQGTLFLDEIGELPLELQPKLLRVLQEREFERLGSVRTIRSDARLVAASNRDLKSMVEENQFRRDLYYRLNVFPIVVPPLRDRKEDIPYLVLHFTQECARRFGKKILSVPTEAIERLVRYHWPGNIRELQNLVERSVILTSGDTLRIPLQELESEQAASGGPPSSTMEDVERTTILRALREAKGVVGGSKGAAAKLGMKRTTLLYRMEKLGIQKPAN